MSQETTLDITPNPDEQENRFGADVPAAPMKFPKEFESSFWERLDKRFLIALILSVLVSGAFIAFLEMNTSSVMSEDDIKRLQQQFAQYVLDSEPQSNEGNAIEFVDSVTPSDDEYYQPSSGRSIITSQSADSRPERVIGEQNGQVNDILTTSSDRASDDIAPPRENTGEINREIPSSARASISQSVSQTGILGLLASSNASSEGKSASEILGEDIAPSAGLEQALANANGGQYVSESGANTSSRLKQRPKGSRRLGSGNIDALVENLDKGESKGLSRSGDLVISNEEPLIETEDGQAGGARDGDEIAAVVSRHNSAIQNCYQRGLKRNPGLKGKLVVRFTIDAHGDIQNATIISSNLKNSSVESCVLNRIKRWEDFGAIDPKKGKTTVRQVYTFGY